MRRIVTKGILLFGLAQMLSACGSGGGGTAAVAPASALASTFTDAGIETFPMEGRTHVEAGTVVVYGTDPPTSGNHYPYPQDGGYYEISIAAGFLVHAMEHGGVILYYNPASLTTAQKNSLRKIADDHPGLYSQAVCVPRNDPAYPLILTAWTHRLRLATYDQSRIDGFLALFLGQGPEVAPESPWGDPLTSNATATSYYTSAAYLRIAATARPASASTATGAVYDAQSSISVDLKASGSSTLADTQTIQVLDSTSSAVLAQAVYDASTGRISFSIGAVFIPSVTIPVGSFHTVMFHADSSHNARWSVEGSVTNPAVAFSVPKIRLALRAAFGSGGAPAPEFFFGNLLVSGP